jgi:enoyl-CoA hydratase/carnithine racemase
MAVYEFQRLQVAVERGVAFVTLDNPPINLLDRALTRELGAFGKTVIDDPEVRVIVFQSADPDFFIAHSDVNELRSLPPAATERPTEPGPFHKIVDRFRTMPKITIGKVEGRARGGGCEFLMALDMRFAALEGAVFGQPEVSVGLLPGGGGTQRLPRHIGRGRALEMILGCGDYDAVTAERYGLINRALPAEELTPFVNTLALRIASFPVETLALAKAAVTNSDLPLKEGLIEEERLFRAALETTEAKRRMERFLSLGGQTRELEMRPMEEIFSPLAEE